MLQNHNLVLAIFICSLAGCGLIQDRSAEYTEVERGDTLKLPESLSDLKINPRYPVPAVRNATRTADSYELPKPPSTTSSQSEQYSIEEADGKIWLNLAMAPGRVWPLLDFYIQEKGLSMASENVGAGILNISSVGASTALLNEISPEAKDAVIGQGLSIALTQGVRRKTTELSVSLVTKTGSNLVAQELLENIGEFVTSDEQQNRQSLLANDIASEPKVMIITDSSSPFIKFDLSLERSWIELEKAVRASGLIVADTDRSQRKYFISYFDEGDLDSWFVSQKRLAQKRKEMNFELQLEKLSSDTNNSSYKLTAKDLRKAPDPKKVSELLELIYEHIS